MYYIIILHISMLFQKLWALCDLASGLLLTRTTNYDLKDFSSETRIPTMYFMPQQDFVNTRVFLPPELQYQPNVKPSITLSMLNSDRQKKPKPKKPEGCGPLGTDVQVSFILINF